MQVGTAGKLKSIFDIIEEQAVVPVHLVWTTDLALSVYDCEDLLLEGDLQSYNEAKSAFVRRRYVLTKAALIRYKVSSLLTSLEIASHRAQSLSAVEESKTEQSGGFVAGDVTTQNNDIGTDLDLQATKANASFLS